MTEPYTLTLDLPKNGGRRFVIADIHGCFYSFQALVKKLNLTTEDHLFILGDMINRGKRSKFVIDFILHLYSSGYKVYPLQGNHEHVLAQTLLDMQGVLPTSMKKTGSLFSFVENGVIKAEYDVFFRTLPHCILTGEDHVLVHAGLNFNGDPLKDYNEMLIIRDYIYDGEKIGYRRLIHGHTPSNLTDIKKGIEKKYPVLNLDNGCVMKDKREDKGNLLCLDIDSQQLYIQKNID